MSIMTWEAQTDDICDKSRTIVPVHKRLNGLNSDNVVVRALCTYVGKEVSVVFLFKSSHTASDNNF